MDDGELEQLRTELNSATCRVYRGAPAPDTWKGSAFAVGPRAFLTAAHVAKDLWPDQIYLGPPAFDPPQRVQRVVPHPHRDVALLLFDAAAPACRSPHVLSDKPLVIGEEILSCGFSSWHQSLNLISTTVTAYEGAVTQFVAKPHITKGMSGGPVLRGRKAVGIVCARDTDKSDHYLISAESFRDLLEENAAVILPERDSLTPVQSELLAHLRSPVADSEISTALIDAVRAQRADNLTAYRLKRIAHWRQRDFELDRRFVKLVLLLDYGPQNEAGRFLKSARFDDLGQVLARPPTGRGVRPFPSKSSPIVQAESRCPI